jgi:glycosyltransferase involved in cell wall biosynthesis
MVATVSKGCGSMLSAIIATFESERVLVPTLAALVPGAAAGIIAEVVIADGGSRDATAEVADVAGCRFISSSDALGVRLKAAAASVRSPWLLFLQAGAVPQPGWIDAADHFMRATDQIEGAARAAIFRPLRATGHLRPTFSEIVALLRSALGSSPRPDQGLLIARRFYDALGGHPPTADAETALLRRIGRGRTVVLSAAIATSLRNT